MKSMFIVLIALILGVVYTSANPKYIQCTQYGCSMSNFGYTAYQALPPPQPVCAPHQPQPAYAPPPPQPAYAPPPPQPAYAPIRPSSGIGCDTHGCGPLVPANTPNATTPSKTCFLYNPNTDKCEHSTEPMTSQYSYLTWKSSKCTAVRPTNDCSRGIICYGEPTPDKIHCKNGHFDTNSLQCIGKELSTCFPDCLFENGAMYYIKGSDGRFVVVDANRHLAFMRNVPMTSASIFVFIQKHGCSWYGLCSNGHCMSRYFGPWTIDAGHGQQVRFDLTKPDIPVSSWQFANTSIYYGGEYNIRHHEWYVTYRRTSQNEDLLTLAEYESVQSRFQLIPVQTN